MDRRPITVFCDIDGTLVKHQSPTTACKKSYNNEDYAVAINLDRDKGILNLEI